jgi:CRISPR-associated protein Csm3
MAEFKSLKMKLLIDGEIETLTGLHIGGNDAGLGIGGADRLVVRNPEDNRPYIPGSSVKGKLRSLLERSGEAKGIEVKEEKDEEGNVVGFTVKPCECGRHDCLVCLVFGIPAGKTKYEEDKPSAGAARLIVRDSHLTPGTASEMEKWRHLDMPYTEIKTEVSIDRLTSAANPRQFERVPAGARFVLSLVLNVSDGDNDGRDNLNLVLRGLKLMADDYLGGQGSRGYGAVKITVTSVRSLSIDQIKDKQVEPQDCASTYGLTLPLVYDSRVPQKKVA